MNWEKKVIERLQDRGILNLSDYFRMELFEDGIVRLHAYFSEGVYRKLVSRTAQKKRDIQTKTDYLDIQFSHYDVQFLITLWMEKTPVKLSKKSS